MSQVRALCPHHVMTVCTVQIARCVMRLYQRGRCSIMTDHALGVIQCCSCYIRARIVTQSTIRDAVMRCVCWIVRRRKACIMRMTGCTYSCLMRCSRATVIVVCRCCMTGLTYTCSRARCKVTACCIGCKGCKCCLNMTSSSCPVPSSRCDSQYSSDRQVCDASLPVLPVFHHDSPCTWRYPMLLLLHSRLHS